MDKFTGILFFYTLAFLNKKEKYRKEWNILSEYLGEKSRRFIGFTINRTEWEFLKILLKDFPEPDKDLLTDDHLYELINIFHQVFEMENIDYELRMYGIDETEERKTINEVFDNFSKYVDIIAPSNGVSITLGDWLSKPEYNRTLIEREINLIEIT